MNLNNIINFVIAFSIALFVTIVILTAIEGVGAEETGEGLSLIQEDNKDITLQFGEGDKQDPVITVTKAGMLIFNDRVSHDAVIHLYIFLDTVMEQVFKHEGGKP